MSSATNKLTTERNQRLLLELLSKPGNGTSLLYPALSPLIGSLSQTYAQTVRVGIPVGHLITSESLFGILLRI